MFVRINNGSRFRNDARESARARCKGSNTRKSARTRTRCKGEEHKKIDFSEECAISLMERAINLRGCAEIKNLETALLTWIPRKQGWVILVSTIPQILG